MEIIMEDNQMGAPNAATVSTEASGQAAAAESTQQDNQLIAQLVEAWRTHGEVDLELRHHTGQRLNATFGLPGSRQNRGAKVLKEAAKQLHVAESDISRMRWFAMLFVSFADFKQHNPGVDTWSAIKDQIVKLKRTHEFQDLFTQTLDELAPHFVEARKDLTEAEKLNLLEKAQVFVKAVSCHLGISVPVDGAAMAFTPSLVPEPPTSA